jgi:hypothetical protein
MVKKSGLPDFSYDSIPKWGEIYQITIKYTKWPQTISNNLPNGRKMDQMAIKFTNISPKPSQNLPKLGFWVSKYAIWQPCSR